MTASKLEESIDEITGIFDPFRFTEPIFRERLAKALHAFAEAVREKMPVEECRKTHKWEWMCRECGVRKPPCDHNGKHLGQHCPELKECASQCHRGCKPCCSCGEPAALPDEVKEKIKEIMETTKIYGSSLVQIDYGMHYGGGFREILEDLCRLCLSLRKGTK